MPWPILLGFVQISTNRAAQGIAECERALALDRNLAGAHAEIGLAKYNIGRAEETEAHIHEALRLCPRDTSAYAWMAFAGFAKLYLGSDEEAVSVVASRHRDQPKLFPRNISLSAGPGASRSAG